MITIGQQFAEERKQQGLSIEEVAKATKIKEPFLRAIEKGDFKSLPSPAYAYGFVRNYAKFLGLPVEKSLAIFRREYDEKKNIEVLPRGLANPKEYVPPKFRFGRSLALLFLVFVAVAGFLAFQYRAAFLDPGLKVETPQDDQEFRSLEIEVKGETDPAASLQIDQKQVPVNSDGTFTKIITVFPGESVITFQVENKFGRVTTVERKILVRPN